jgi:hypothetical protein
VWRGLAGESPRDSAGCGLAHSGGYEFAGRGVCVYVKTRGPTCPVQFWPLVSRATSGLSAAGCVADRAGPRITVAPRRCKLSTNALAVSSSSVTRARSRCSRSGSCVSASAHACSRRPISSAVRRPANAIRVSPARRIVRRRAMLRQQQIRDLQNVRQQDRKDDRNLPDPYTNLESPRVASSF